MDILDIDIAKTADEGAVMKVKHPSEHTVVVNDDGTEMTITLLGADAERYKKAYRANLNRRIKAGRRGMATAEEIEADSIDLLTVATLDWNVQAGKDKVECTPDEVRGLYRKLGWLREQVDEFVGDRANFVKASS